MPTRRKSTAKVPTGEPDERQTDPIRILISSRNRDLIPAASGGTVPLLDVRRALSKEIEDEKVCGQKIFKVWINEAAGAQSGDADVWEQCRQRLEDAHIIIAIYNGEAGWSHRDQGIGICHEELKYARDRFPSKLYLIDVAAAYAKVRPPDEGPVDAARQARNLGFVETIDDWKRWKVPVDDDEGLKAAARLAVANAVHDLVDTGSREGRKGRYYSGAPLDWSRLSYQERKEQIETTLTGGLLNRKGMARPAPEPADGTPAVVWTVRGKRVLLLVHGVPSSFSISEARELVGRPYLSDHRSLVATGDGDLAGPVHVIACHKSCTESQIFSFMGHPDVYIVQAPFGFFAADLASFAQTFFLTNCRDRNDTLIALERMFDWIAEADEQSAIVDRARSRQRILKTVRAEIDAREKSTAK
jgi:hypothetical protein